jgi:hypothetical protein
MQRVIAPPRTLHYPLFKYFVLILFQHVLFLWELTPLKKDVKLYELLALVDAVRIGRAREKEIAIKELKSRILGSNESNKSNKLRNMDG